MALYLAVAVTALVLGFLAGLLTFKRSLTWCKHCGATLSCAICTKVRQPARMSR